jgi:hypothetical protein
MARPLLILIAFALSLVACEPGKTGGQVLPALSVREVGPKTLVNGSRLVISGTGFSSSDVCDLLVVMRGAIDGEPFEFGVPPARVDDETLTLDISGQVASALIRPSGRLVGRLTVLRTPKIDAPVEEKGRDIDLAVAGSLSPFISGLSPSPLYVGDLVTLSGAGFLFPTEGASLVEFTGTMTTDLPPRVVRVEGLQVPGEPGDDARETLLMTLTPDVLGILPGRFVGEVRVINYALDGTSSTSPPFAVDLPLAPPVVDAVEPLAASRGQWIRIRGRGFTAADGLLQAATVLILEGKFTPRGGVPTALAGGSALSLIPDLQADNTLLSAVLRVERDPQGELSGFGLTPGLFDGTITPVLLLGPDLVRGTPAALRFEVLPAKQVVYMRALPGFDDALAEFGLLAEKEAVKRRILEVVTRDYQGIHIEFTWEEPRDYAEYGVVEIAGRDPNGTGLFGLDNTTGKDVGNLRFNDIIGGYNADTQASGYSAYGGVFPGEFMNLSARIGDNPLASSRFDDTFGPVAPALGGTPAAPGEGDASGMRAADVREAVRVFGNLVGSTVSHEVGHSLGLAAVDGQFHNIGDNPGWLMDSGTYRSFEERAELDGQGPSFFEEGSLAYLRSILPVP